MPGTTRARCRTATACDAPRRDHLDPGAAGRLRRQGFHVLETPARLVNRLVMAAPLEQPARSQAHEFSAQAHERYGLSGNMALCGKPDTIVIEGAMNRASLKRDQLE